MADAREHYPLVTIETADTLDGKSAASDRQNDVPIPARIGRYLILKRVGQGGMGVVYAAYDAALDRKIALKVVREGFKDSSQGRSRVMLEAQAMARLAHPNVVHVYEVGQDPVDGSGHLFIAMEFVPGLPLSEWVRRNRDTASVGELVRLHLQAAAGLAAAHASGLIHRDFKPDNVLVGDDGRARVVDFGLARALDRAQRVVPKPDAPLPSNSPGSRLTEVGAVLGTPGYMAPEQVLGEEADARSDQFSFCVALYEALYRQLPFAGDTFEEFAINVLDGKLSRAPEQGLPLEIPILVEQALRRGLSRDPSARFPSMGALSAALSAGIGPSSDSERARRRKRRTLVVGCGAILVLVAFRMLKPERSGTQDLTRSMIVGWLMLLIAGSVMFALRKQLLRHSVSRHGTYFFVVMMAFVALSRTIRFLVGIPDPGFHALEELGLAMMVALEIPFVGKSYIWPLVFLLASSGLVMAQRTYGPLLCNACLGIAALLAVFLRPWSAQVAELEDRHTR